MFILSKILIGEFVKILRVKKNFLVNVHSHFRYISKKNTRHDYETVFFFCFTSLRGMMSLARYSSFKLENLSAYLDPETNRLMLHVVEECPATYFLAYVAQQNSPYVERIDRLILRMQQAGLIGMWYQDMLETVKIVTIRSKLKQRNKRSKLTVAHISLTLVLLGIGLFISTLIFLGEIYCAMKFGSPVTRLMLNRS